VGRQSEVSNHVELTVPIRGDDGPAGGRIQSFAWRTSHSATFFGIERFVGFPDGLDDGVAMFETGTKGPEARLQAGRKIGAPACRGRRAMQREASTKSVSPMPREGGADANR
jgi:hypothetical protein